MSAAPSPITPEAAAAFNAANMAFREGRFEEARDAAARAAQLAPDLAIAHVLKARTLRRLGDEAAAQAAYDAALIADPTSFDALLERGKSCGDLSNPLRLLPAIPERCRCGLWSEARGPRTGGCG